MKARITKRVVDALKAPAKGEAWVWDIEIRGFGIRARGKALTYFLKYGSGRAHRSRKVALGEHGRPWRPDPQTGLPRTLTAELARDEAIRLLGQKLDGKDPSVARHAARAVPTLKEFAPRYLTDYVEVHKKTRSQAEDRRLLKRHILPALGDVRLDRITTGFVVRMHVGLKATPVTANRCVSLVSAMIGKASKWGDLARNHPNPCTDVDRFDETERERFLSPDELKRLGPVMAAAEAAAQLKKSEREKGALVVDPYVIAALRVLMFTGARPTEVLSLERAQLQLELGVILQDSKTGRRPIYLNPPAVEVLANTPELAGNPYVFPGRKKGQHVTLWALDRAWSRIRTVAKLEDVRAYDLRHTFASVGAARGDSLYILGGLLGHKNPKTTQRYAHLAAAPLHRTSSEVATEIDRAMRQ